MTCSGPPERALAGLLVAQKALQTYTSNDSEGALLARTTRAGTAEVPWQTVTREPAGIGSRSTSATSSR